MGHHGLQDVLAGVQLRFLLVWAHSVANLFFTEANRCLESRLHVVIELILVWGGLYLELSLGNLGQQRDLVGAAGGKISVLKQVLVVAQLLHCLLRQQS